MVADWFTFAAQVVNFLILVYLLRRFLYKPILRALDDREKSIAARVAEAEEKLAEAGKEREDFRLKNEALDEQRESLLARARSEADSERTRLLKQVDVEMEDLRAKRQAAIRSEERELNRQIVRWTQDEVFAIAGKVLADLASAKLEERITEVFLGRLRGLNGPDRERLAAALNKPSSSALVQTSFDLAPAGRQAIESAIRETLEANAQVKYQTTPDLVSGIELSANGQKVAWSIADYLAKQEMNAVEFLRTDPKIGPTPDATPNPELEPTTSTSGGHS